VCSRNECSNFTESIAGRELRAESRDAAAASVSIHISPAKSTHISFAFLIPPLVLFPLLALSYASSAFPNKISSVRAADNAASPLI
jgi:hypothetical protein